MDLTEGDLYLQLFEGLFPTDYLETVLLKKTNQSIEGESVTYGELLRWIGIGSSCQPVMDLIVIHFGQT